MSVTGNKQDLVYVGPQDQQLPAADLLVVVDGDTTPTRLGTALTGGGGDVPASGPLTGTEVIRFTQDGEEVEGTTQDIADLGGGGVVVEQITTSGTPTVLSPPFADRYEVTTGGTSGNEFISIVDYLPTASAVVKTIQVVVVSHTDGDVPRVRRLESDGVTSGQMSCFLRDKSQAARAVDQELGYRMELNSGGGNLRPMTLEWSSNNGWMIDFSRSDLLDFTDALFINIYPQRQFGALAKVVQIGEQDGSLVGLRTGIAVAVADLPSVAVVGGGIRAFVTDSNATLAAGLGNVVAAGGANFVPVYSDSSDSTWRIGG